MGRLLANVLLLIKKHLLFQKAPHKISLLSCADTMLTHGGTQPCYKWWERRWLAVVHSRQNAVLAEGS